MKKRSGKSKSHENPFGIRRKENGQDLSPRSIRNQKKWLKDCTDSELEKAGIKEK